MRLRWATVATTAATSLFFGWATTAQISALVSPVVRAIHDPNRLEFLNNLVMRSRGEFGPERYLELVLETIGDLRPGLIVIGSGLVLCLLRQSPAVSSAIDRFCSAVLSSRAVAWVAMTAFAVLFRINTILNPSSNNWDEDLFLTVAQRLSIGELPFTTTLENKPPLLSLLQAPPFVLGLDSPSLIRLFLAIIIGSTAFLVSRVVLRLGGAPTPAVVAGLVFTVGVSISPNGGGGMSHHFANLILAGATSVAVADSVAAEARDPAQSGRRLGLLLGILVLTRTNYAVPGSLLLIHAVVSTNRASWARFLAGAAAGGGAILGVVVAAYAASGTLSNLWFGLIDILLGPGGAAFGEGGLRSRVLTWVVALVVLQIGLASLAQLKRPGPDGVAVQDMRSIEAGRIWLPSILFGGLLLSLFIHSVVRSHYIGMLMLPLSVQAGLALGGWNKRSGVETTSARSLRVRRLVTQGTAVSAVISVVAISHWGMTGLLNWDAARSAFEAERRLEAELSSRLASEPGSVWAFEQLFVYWRLGIPPAVPEYTLPSSINSQAFRDGSRLFSSRPVPQSSFAAMSAALDRQPRYLITSDDLGEWFLDPRWSDWTDSEEDVFRSRIAHEYEIVWHSDDGSTTIRRYRES